jgi:hypothetical protein
MSTNWIPVCKDTPNKPEILLLAKHLRIPKETAFALWFKLYAWADGQTADGWFPHMTLRDIAEAAEVPEPVCRTLASPDIHWLMECGGDNPGVLIRNWGYHNGKCAKERLQAGRRMQRMRAKAAPKLRNIETPKLLRNCVTS